MGRANKVIKMKNILFFIGFYLGLDEVFGHGAMYIPSPWHATSDCNPSMDPRNCKFHLEVPETADYKCSKPPNGNWYTGSGGCSRDAGEHNWFTNYTSVPEQTLEDSMFDKWGRRCSLNIEGLNPWNSPGAAPVQGNGCGVNGGNQFGCDGVDFVRGRCCGGYNIYNICDGYVGGKPALDHYQDGLFGTPKTTTWTRGVPAEVYWASGSKHRGGYAYRLCRVNDGKVWEVTEECFQDGHLNFHGKTSWIYYKPRAGNYSEDGWQAIDLVSTTEGTTPEGSQWAKMELPRKPQSGDYWAWKDLVDVPETLVPGEYVLSFRWDCQQTPQVWNACANIKVVERPRR